MNKCAFLPQVSECDNTCTCKRKINMTSERSISKKGTKERGKREREEKGKSTQAEKKAKIRKVTQAGEGREKTHQKSMLTARKNVARRKEEGKRWERALEKCE
jgi:hypothetical protein